MENLNHLRFAWDNIPDQSLELFPLAIERDFSAFTTIENYQVLSGEGEFPLSPWRLFHPRLGRILVIRMGEYYMCAHGDRLRIFLYRDGILGRDRTYEPM